MPFPSISGLRVELGRATVLHAARALPVAWGIPLLLAGLLLRRRQEWGVAA